MTASADFSNLKAPQSDVCLIVEGCYPYVSGGVSGWLDWLMRTQPDVMFSMMSLWPQPMSVKPRYVPPPNLVHFEHVYLQQFGAPPRSTGEITPDVAAQLSRSLTRLMTQGGMVALSDVMEELKHIRRRLGLEQLFNSPAAWQIVQDMYRIEMPNASFLDYFWAWRALLSGLLAVLETPLPQANVYHTISTGYAGMLAARATLETGRPSALTEHGIYTNERRIELLMADWVSDTIDKGHALDDPRFDLRDMWVRAFESYARTCYESASDIITLYRDNQVPQRILGAAPCRMSVIANGIDVAKFADVPQASELARPTIALIGRVVPIKDVKTFILALRQLADRIPNVRGWVMGPSEEDPSYFRECKALVAELGLEGTVEFTGPVNIVEYLPHIHVMALTSLSESQPLVVLEAGAAGIPFIATDVGSCREIIEGRHDEIPNLGSGGVITHLAAADEIASAAATLLSDHVLRRQAGEVLKARVSKYYTSQHASAAYSSLYSRLSAVPDLQHLSGAA